MPLTARAFNGIVSAIVEAGTNLHSARSLDAAEWKSWNCPILGPDLVLVWVPCSSLD